MNRETLPTPKLLNISSGISSNSTISDSVNIGSTSNSLTLTGSTGIRLNGGLFIQYDNITSWPSSTIELTDSHHFIEISTPTVNRVLLPDADGRPGKMYIISKNFEGGVLRVDTQMNDKLDNLTHLDLTLKDERFSLISGGIDRWLMV